ncbi:MAG: hypothetical protein H8D23_27870 [Candidatus Brocadiales bacterium]|nr:hypothetical protein [Candidatus Brocadiales bacterium]
MTLEELRDILHAEMEGIAERIVQEREYPTNKITTDDCTIGVHDNGLQYRGQPVIALSTDGYVYDHLGLLVKFQQAKSNKDFAESLLVSLVQDLVSKEKEFLETNEYNELVQLHYPHIFAETKDSTLHLSMYETVSG